MRWTKRNKSYKYTQWHKWFAWYPVMMQEDRYIWLEIILRKQDHDIEYCWFDRMLFVPTYEYKECIFDLL